MSSLPPVLTDYGLDITDLASVNTRLMARGADFSDVFLQQARYESWVLEDSKIKTIAFHEDAGFGVRAVSGDCTGITTGQTIDTKTLLAAATSAAQITSGTRSTVCRATQKHTKRSYYAATPVITTYTDTEKADVLARIDRRCRAEPRVIEVIASISAAESNVVVATDAGAVTTDTRPMITLSVSVVVQSDKKTEKATAGIGGRTDYGLLDEQTVFAVCDDAVRSALLLLDARPAPAGEMPVVLGPGWPGVLLHEAVGHGLEADFNRKGSSVFRNKIGTQVAARGCTVIDDATIPNTRGALTIDDEGCEGQRTVLIEDGILRCYMQDRLSARIMGMPQTGNGRRQSYAHMPMPRMTNTFLANGNYEQNEIVASLENGIYAVNFGGGQVDITSGSFVFSMSEAYFVKNGVVQYPVKGAVLIGNGPEVMRMISMVGNDLALDKGMGTCGKNGQSVPVCVGQPTVRIDAITVGGTG